MHTIDWSNITITDDLMFTTVFSDPELCKGLLERVLGFAIRKVVITQRERAVVPELGSRGIRMDVYAADEEGTIYDIEMQKVDKGSLEKRSRYCLSANDMDCIAPGMLFDQIRDSYVIFICLFDPLGYELPRYTVTPHVRENGREMPDGAVRLLLNARAYDQCEDPRLACLLHYLASGTIGDKFCESVDNEVRRQRDLPEWRSERMRFEWYVAERENLARAEGREEGREEGRAEGRAEGREEGREEGRAEGREEGREEGRAEGRVEGILDAAARLLEGGEPIGRVRELLGLTDEQAARLVRT